MGQALVIQFSKLTHTVRSGETLSAIASQYGISSAVARNNPVVGGGSIIYPGQTLVIAFQGEKLGSLTVNGYAYPFIGRRELQALLPYLTYLTPFTYGITAQGGLISPDDSILTAMAHQSGTAPCSISLPSQRTAASPTGWPAWYSIIWMCSARS